MKTLKWGLLYTAAFLAAFVGSALLKINSDPTHGKYNTRWDETVGKVYTDLPYGEGAANKFDLYVPADKSQDAYGLVVYLHAGGFTSGDKAGDAEMLKWLCSKGYVAAGINYTLFTEENPDASVYSQSDTPQGSVQARTLTRCSRKSPSVIAFLLVCLGILAYLCQNTSRDNAY